MAETIEVLESIFDQIDAFIYRCKNDTYYTMEYIAGNVLTLCGYSQEDLLLNKTVAWTAITHPDDVDRAFAVVDAALEQRDAWDMEYRVLCKDGSSTWVRERGSGVFVDGELAYLQGLIMNADSDIERRLEEAAAKDAAQAAKERNAKRITDQIIRSVGALFMLSVNARIEASASGDTGRGFAVVADEIGRLAKQNEKLARDILKVVS